MQVIIVTSPVGISALHLGEGDLIVAQVPAEMVPAAVQILGRELADILRHVTPTPHQILLMAQGSSLKTLDEDAMRDLGWERVKDPS